MRGHIHQVRKAKSLREIIESECYMNVYSCEKGVVAELFRVEFKVFYHQNV